VEVADQQPRVGGELNHDHQEVAMLREGGVGGPAHGEKSMMHKGHQPSSTAFYPSK
jgi:hypothetical protein